MNSKFKKSFITTISIIIISLFQLLANQPMEFKLATAVENGTYHRLGKSIKSVLNEINNK